MAMSVTCYGGVAEIGGNKVLLEDGDVRLLLDFGTPFGRQERFFNEYLRPRPARGLLDLMCLGLIPPLQGIYQADLAPPGLWERFGRSPLYRDLRRNDGPALNAVFISHAHLDHNGDLSYLDPDIPVCTTRITAFVARAMQISGQSGFERELAYVNPREWDDSQGVLRTVKGAPYRARTHVFLDGPLSIAAKQQWEASPAKKPLRAAASVGLNDCLTGQQVRFWPVDHSVPGAAAYAIRTSAGWVGYTGDIRFHGKSTTAMERFVKELAELEPVALLCEGTSILHPAFLAGNVGDRAPVTEEQVASNALRLVQQATGQLVVADFSPRNVERLLTFLQVAEETGRLLAIQPKDAFLLQGMSLAAPRRNEEAAPWASVLHRRSGRLPRPAEAVRPASGAEFVDPLTMPGVVLYADPKSAPRAWEKDLRQQWGNRTVGPAEVRADPGNYILCFSLWDANDLLDLPGVEGGLYLYSNSRAYDEEQSVDLQRLRNWVQHVGLHMEGDPDNPEHVPLHASGHAPGPQLLDFVQRVHPRILIPVHTEQPKWWLEALAGTDIAVALPEMGQSIPVRR
jgi:ribonuclease J